MNLLPNVEKNILKQGLKSRFNIVVLIFTALAFFLGFVMLLPSYFLIKVDFSRNANTEIVPEDEGVVKELLKLPAELNSKLKIFQSNVESKKSIDFLSEVISNLPKEVKLDSISFNRNQLYKGKNNTVILVSGVAATRDSLVSFSNLLKGIKSFSSVDIPVSSLTKDKNLPFSITIYVAN